MLNKIHTTPCDYFEATEIRDTERNLIPFEDFVLAYTREVILDHLGEEGSDNTQGGIVIMTCPDIITEKTWGELVEYELGEMEAEGLVKKLPYQDEDVWCLAEDYEKEIEAMRKN